MVWFYANMQDVYKWCERLHKFIGKKVIAIQKLNSRHYARLQKKFWFAFYNGVRLIFGWLLLSFQ
jgi:hypothetical protein